jgi:hypothetical protein
MFQLGALFARVLVCSCASTLPYSTCGGPGQLDGRRGRGSSWEGYTWKMRCRENQRSIMIDEIAPGGGE